jgi:isocitrate lyase
VWCETGRPDLDFARRFAEAVQKAHPGKLLAYNCSPSFNWKRNLDDAAIGRFQRELGAMGYKFQFITAEKGFTAVKHQREVGTSYFDAITQVVAGGAASTTALHGSTEDEQLFDEQRKARLAAV